MLPAPEWLATALGRPSEPPAPSVPRTASSSSSTRYGTAVLDRLAAEVASAPEGTRNDTLNRAAHRAGGFVAGNEIDESAARDALLDAAIHAGLPAREAEKTIESGLGTGKATVRKAPEKPRALTPRAPHWQAELPEDGREPDPVAFAPLTLESFLERDLPRRTPIVAPFLFEKSLSMLYGRRGCGKTWFCQGIGLAAASGGVVFDARGRAPAWAAPRPRTVLHIDGEMPGPMLQERFALLVAGRRYAPAGRLRILAADLAEDPLPSIARPEGQGIVNAHLDGVDLVILDNISTLFRGLDENDAAAWDPVQEWLLSLRRRGIAVLLVHHGGKSGVQRGTSKREDVLDNVISLRLPDDILEEEGASVHVVFEKARGLVGPDVVPFAARLNVSPSGAIWTASPIVDPNDEEIMKFSRNGMSQRAIAEKVGMDQATVSRRLKRLAAAGGDA